MHFSEKIKVFICTCAIFLFWTRQFISYVFAMAGFSNTLVHIIELVSIIVTFFFFGKTIISRVNSSRPLKTFLCILVGMILIFFFSNVCKDFVTNNAYKAESNKFMKEWYLQIAVLFAMIGIFDYLFRKNQILLFIRCFAVLLLLISFVGTYYFFCYTNDIQPWHGASLEKLSIYLGGGNRMVFGKLFFLTMVILFIHILLDKKNKSIIIRSLFFLGIIIMIGFSIFISVRTAILAFLSLLLLYMWQLGLKDKTLFRSLIFCVIFCFLFLVFEPLVKLPIKTLDKFTINIGRLSFKNKTFDNFSSGRYTSALLSVRMYLEQMTDSPRLFLLGYGNYYSAKMFYHYYCDHVLEYESALDLRNFLTIPKFYGAHSAYGDILISNGLLGFIAYMCLLMYMFKVLRRLNRYAKNTPYKKELRLFLIWFLVIATIFYGSDMDFVGNRISTISLFSSFLFAIFYDRYHLRTFHMHNEFLKQKAFSPR